MLDPAAFIVDPAAVMAEPAAAGSAVAATVGLAAVLSASSSRRLSFATLDTQKAVRYLHSFPSAAFGMWSVVEWERLGVPAKLEFGTQQLDNGVRLIYYLTPAETRSRGLAGLVEDGGFELLVSGNSIVARADPGRINRSKQEEVIWQRLVLQVTKGIAMERAGAKPELGEVRGGYRCSMESEIAYMAQRRASDSLWKRY